MSVSMDPNYFAEYYKQINLGEGSSIALIGNDCILRVRQSDNDVNIGLDFSKRVASVYSKASIGHALRGRFDIVTSTNPG